MTSTVKVAVFRDETDHLHRVANVDYHACVGVREIELWKDTAVRVLAAAEGLQCSRANAYDREQFTKAIAAVQVRLIDADARIAQLQVKRDLVGPCNVHLAQDCHNGCPYRVRRQSTTNSESKSIADMTRCADCMTETPIDALAKTLFQCNGLSERLDPGSEVPAGECECGAFAYVIPTADQQLADMPLPQSEVSNVNASQERNFHFHVDVENNSREWFDTADDALRHAASKVFLSAEAFAKGKVLLESGSDFLYCYGFNSVCIAHANREVPCARTNEAAGVRETCEECSNEIPVFAGGSLANKHHAQSCSLFDPTFE